jgi:branched-chain amino acid transport system ATP-binding protein
MNAPRAINAALPKTDVAIDVSDVIIRFGTFTAVDRVSFSVARGEVFGLLGPNGSGKTTLINLLTGLFPFDSGTVWIEGRPLQQIRRESAAALGLTRTFQSVRLAGQISVWDNLMLVFAPKNPFLAMIGRDDLQQKARAEELLRRISLWEKRDELAENLSYGQRKLLEIARALAMNAQVIFLDEPFAGLFAEMSERVKQILFELRRQGRAVVLVEHNMEIIRSVCDQILFLDEGALMAQGPAEDVFSRPQVLEAYLGE